MNAIDVAEIPCQAQDGTCLATLLITPDMADEDRVELAPILSVTPEEALENGETEFQLRENGRYYYDLQSEPGAPSDLRLRCHLARRRRNLAGTAPDAGRIETGNFCGTLLLEIVDGDVADQAKPALASTLLDVRSIKLDYRSEYRGMLRDLAGRMADLVADARSSTKASFRSNFDERDDNGWFHVQLELLREVLESADFAAALHRIISYPHERLEQELEFVPTERPLKWTPGAIRSLINSPVRRALPATHQLRHLTRLDSIAAHVPIVRSTPTTDTAENRFVKHALRDFHAFLTRAQRLFDSASGNWSAAAGLARRLSLNLEQWLSRPFFKEVGRLDVVPFGSPVLQRKAGYRELLRWWLRFRTAAELSWRGGEDLFRAGQRSVSDLYEYWLFFVLLDWFCQTFNRDGEPPLLDQLVEGLDGDYPNLRLRKRLPLGPFAGEFVGVRRSVYASFSYNREFKVTENRSEGGSWSRMMHPDYTLTFWPVLDGATPEEAAKLAEEQELLVHIHFDAKYRVSSLKALFGGRGSGDADEEDPASPGNYKRQDLLKMHAYRDAIKRSEGAYILYPGNDRSRFVQLDSKAAGPERWRQTMRGFHEILPGLGAFAIAPDGTGKPKGIDGPGQLKAFLRDVLENLCSRASLREERSSSLYEALRERRALRSAGEPTDSGNLILQDVPELDADNLRVPAATEITVLIAWFESAVAKDWMLNNERVVVRLGNRRGSLPLIRSLATASHILLHGRNYATVPGLLRIGSGAGEVWTRTEVQNAGFPSNPAKDQDDIFAVFEVERDLAFASLNWDGRLIENALIRYRNRRRPSYRAQLKALRRERAKPQLVALADLEVALAASD